MQLVSKDISKAVGITKYFLSLPSSRYIFVILCALSIVFALAFAYMTQVSIVQALLSSFLLIVFPATLAALIFRLTRGILLKRSMFLMFIASFLYMIVYLVYFYTKDINIIILGYSIIFLIVFMCSYYIFRLKYSGVVLSIIQLFFFSVMLYYLELITSSPKDMLLKLSVASFILSVFAYILIYLINAPLKRAFSIPGMHAFSLFASQWLYESKDLEKEFDRIGTYVNTYVDALLIKNNDGKYLITIPHVHFGPFGNLGGSEFTYLISSSLEKNKITDGVAVLHGACTHDYNPTTSKQLANLTSPLKEFIANAELHKPKVCFVKTTHGKAIASHLVINSSVLSTFSRYPYTTEDMDFGLGLLLREIGTKRFATCMIADEHNSETGEITQFLVGTHEADEYVSSMRAFINSHSKLKMENARFAFKKLNDEKYQTYGVVGKNGISLFCIITRSNSVLYVVFDSNGITNTAKSYLEKKLSKYFNNIVVMTTDTHTLNKVSGIVNPVEIEDVVSLEDDLTEAAKYLLAHASSFQYSAKTIPVRVKVFGQAQSLKLIGTINATISILKLILPLILLFSALITLWALSLL
ncbi:MAG: DUF2070 family protein [Candidatus Micrarchaeia archaeon]